MIDVFKLKISDRLIYHVPETEENENLRQLDGHIVEVVDTIGVYTPVTFDAVLKIVVRDEKTGEEVTLSGLSYQYLEPAQIPINNKNNK